MGESVASRTVPALTFVRLCGSRLHWSIGCCRLFSCSFLIFPFFSIPVLPSLCPVHRLRRALSRLPWIAYADTGRICVTEYSDNPEYRCISHAQSSGDRMKAARHRTGSSDTPSPPIPPASVLRSTYRLGLVLTPPIGQPCRIVETRQNLLAQIIGRAAHAVYIGFAAARGGDCARIAVQADEIIGPQLLAALTLAARLEALLVPSCSVGELRERRTSKFGFSRSSSARRIPTS